MRKTSICRDKITLLLKSIFKNVKIYVSIERRSVMKNLAGKLLAKIALASAKAAAGTSSVWNLYQPKEPKNIKNAK